MPWHDCRDQMPRTSAPVEGWDHRGYSSTFRWWAGRWWVDAGGTWLPCRGWPDRWRPLRRGVGRKSSKR